MTKPKSPPCAEATRRHQLQEKAERFDRENWGLPPDQRLAATKLNGTATDLMTSIAKHGGMKVGAIGQELANLSAVGFIEFTPSDHHRQSIANLTREGALALLLRHAERAAANAPKGRRRQANGHDADEADDREARTAA